MIVGEGASVACQRFVCDIVLLQWRWRVWRRSRRRRNTTILSYTAHRRCIGPASIGAAMSACNGRRSQATRSSTPGLSAGGRAANPFRGIYGGQQLSACLPLKGEFQEGAVPLSRSQRANQRLVVAQRPSVSPDAQQANERAIASLQPFGRVACCLGTLPGARTPDVLPLLEPRTSAASPAAARAPFSLRQCASGQETALTGAHRSPGANHQACERIGSLESSADSAASGPIMLTGDAPAFIVR